MHLVDITSENAPSLTLPLLGRELVCFFASASNIVWWGVDYCSACGGTIDVQSILLINCSFLSISLSLNTRPNQIRQAVLAAATLGALAEEWRKRKGRQFDWKANAGAGVFPFIASGSRGWAAYYARKKKLIYKTISLRKFDKSAHTMECVHNA